MNQLVDLAETRITTDNIDQFVVSLSVSDPADIADLLVYKPIDQSLVIFDALPEKRAVQTFEFLPPRYQVDILTRLPSQQVAALLDALAPDDRTALLEDLPASLVTLLLKYLSSRERALSLKLLNYPENSIGRLMTPDYIAIRMDWTVGQVLEYIRQNGHDSETINIIYAVDDQGKLVDDFRIRQFFLSSLDTKVEQLADHRFVALHVEDNEEVAINTFRKYGRAALPVTDVDGLLLGIVTLDDALSVATKEDTEDIQKIGGTLALDEPYMAIPLFRLIGKRVGWLTVLFLGELMTASAMGYFEDEIAKAVVLALFVPLIISSGGNAGSQASTLIIRAMALGEVTLRDWWHIMRRELIVGTTLGLSLGFIGFLRVALWGAYMDVYGAHWLMLAFTVCFSLVGVVTWGALMGAMFPILLKRAGFDPAVSSAPFVATLVDVTGLIIYFSVALVFLKGSML